MELAEWETREMFKRYYIEDEAWRSGSIPTARAARIEGAAPADGSLTSSGA
jgi:hypothetical protein